MKTTKKEVKKMTKKITGGECVVAIAHDKQTQEYRSIIIPTAMIPPIGLMDPYDMGSESSTIEYMIKQKIAKDGDLIDMDQIHFINWCVGYTSIPKQERSKLQVEAIVQFFANLDVAKKFLKLMKTKTQAA
jgi:hypothetical protein